MKREYGTANAARNGHVDVVNELIQGQTLRPLNQQSETALILASSNGHTGNSHLLIQAGAKLDTQDEMAKQH